MKKELTWHLIAFLVVFLVLTVLKLRVPSDFLVFWLFGLLGTLVPDLDQLLYAFIYHPDEVISQKTKSLIRESNISGALNVFAISRDERTELLFHSFMFELLVVALVFFVLFSTNQLAGQGFVLAFFLHLLVDQAADIRKYGTLANWTWQLPLPPRLFSGVRGKTNSVLVFVSGVLLFCVFSLFS